MPFGDGGQGVDPSVPSASLLNKATPSVRRPELLSNLFIFFNFGQMVAYICEGWLNHHYLYFAITSLLVFGICLPCYDLRFPSCIC